MTASTFSFPECAAACEISVRSVYSFLRYRQFQSPVTKLATPIFDDAHLNFFDQLSVYVNLYQYAKKSAFR